MKLLLSILPSAALATLFAMASPAAAQESDPEPAADRTINLVVYGDDPCPQSSEDEIVVCARRPESERYRIPKSLRKVEQPRRSWGSRVEELDEVSRSTRPGSCSVVGSYGQSGCTQQMINQWYRDRRERRAAKQRR